MKCDGLKSVKNLKKKNSNKDSGVGGWFKLLWQHRMQGDGGGRAQLSSECRSHLSRLFSPLLYGKNT